MHYNTETGKAVNPGIWELHRRVMTRDRASKLCSTNMLYIQQDTLMLESEVDSCIPLGFSFP